MIDPTSIQLIAAILFALAITHTFSTKYFEHLAHIQPRHAGVWHLLGEVEVVFGLWAMILILFIFVLSGKHDAITSRFCCGRGTAYSNGGTTQSTYGHVFLAISVCSFARVIYY